MKAIFSIFFVLLCSFYDLYAQKEAAVWLFNNGSVLDFNFEPPIFSFKTSIPNTEASVQSISNAKGELLFYNIGPLLYDSKNKVIANDIKGTWDGVVIPAPMDEHLFYLITTDAYTHMATDELVPKQGYINDTITSYTTLHVDDNKKLTIIEKNKPLLKNGATRVAATLHTDGVSVWLLTMDVFQKNFYAFLFTDCGISQTVISPLDSNTKMEYGKSGYIRISPNGRKISAYDNFIFDFDPASGLVTNPIQIEKLPIFSGIAFSSDSKYLYGSRPLFRIGDDSSWSRWDVANNKKDTLYLTEGGAPGYKSGLAINGKIYYMCTIPGYHAALGVYDTPNDGGIMQTSNMHCGLADFNLPGTAYPVFPNFISNYFDPGYSSLRAEIGKPIIGGDMRVCERDSVYFTLSRTKAVNEYWWNFGDGSVAHNIKEPVHKYVKGGTYNVSLIVRYNCKFDTLFTQVIIDTLSTYPQQIDSISTCQNIVLEVPLYYETFQWENGETTKTIQVNQPGQYTLTGSNACENLSNVFYIQRPSTELYNVITPNGDGKNDVLVFDKTEAPLLLYVYNRWGAEVYHSDNYQNDWDGGNLSPGVYYYNAKYQGCESSKSWIEIIK